MLKLGPIARWISSRQRPAASNLIPANYTIDLDGSLLGLSQVLPVKLEQQADVIHVDFASVMQSKQLRGLDQLAAKQVMANNPFQQQVQVDTVRQPADLPAASPALLQALPDAQVHSALERARRNAPALNQRRR